MKLYYRLIAVLSVAIILTVIAGCNFNFGCTAESLVASGVSSGISSALQCKNTAQVQADVKALLDKTGVCSTSPKGIVGNLVCPQLATLIVTQMANKIPANWQCAPSGAEASLSTLAAGLCSQIPF